MKFGIRKPSFNKSIAARFSGKRALKNALGLRAPRGMGWITNPKKAMYNRIYNRTTISARKPEALVILLIAGLFVAAFKILQMTFTGLVSLTKWALEKNRERIEAKTAGDPPAAPGVEHPRIPDAGTDFLSAEPVVTTDSEDDLYDQAVELVLNRNQASISLLQRCLKIGYSRAARLLDDMEIRGVVSPADGNGPRKILLAKRLKPAKIVTEEKPTLDESLN